MRGVVVSPAAPSCTADWPATTAANSHHETVSWSEPVATSCGAAESRKLQRVTYTRRAPESRNAVPSGLARFRPRMTMLETFVRLRQPSSVAEASAPWMVLFAATATVPMSSVPTTVITCASAEAAWVANSAAVVARTLGPAAPPVAEAPKPSGTGAVKTVATVHV